MKKEAPDVFDAVPKDELQKHLSLTRYALAAVLEALNRAPELPSGLLWRDTPAARAYRQVMEQTAPPAPPEAVPATEREKMQMPVAADLEQPT